MHWWSPLIWFAPSAPLWFGYILPQMWKRHKRKQQDRNYRRIKKTHEVQPIPYTGLEPEAYCAGCDELRPLSWMAFVDEDDDGVPDALYRCRVCRGLGEPVTPQASQEACNERVEGYYRDVADFANNRGDDTENGHDPECQCSNCEPRLNGWEIGPGHVVEFQELTQEQIENARINNGSLDLSVILADYTAAVGNYRRAGVDATNETDRKYNRRIAKRARAREEREAHLRAKYDMDGEGWRRYARRD